MYKLAGVGFSTLRPGDSNCMEPRSINGSNKKWGLKEYVEGTGDRFYLSIYQKHFNSFTRGKQTSYENVCTHSIFFTGSDYEDHRGHNDER